VATLSSPGGVISGAVVGDVSGIGPQPASTAKRVTTVIADGKLLALVITPPTAASSRERSNVHLSGKGNSASDPN
jgi:hypothetical protein